MACGHLWSSRKNNFLSLPMHVQFDRCTPVYLNLSVKVGRLYRVALVHRLSRELWRNQASSRVYFFGPLLLIVCLRSHGHAAAEFLRTKVTHTQTNRRLPKVTFSGRSLNFHDSFSTCTEGTPLATVSTKHASLGMSRTPTKWSASSGGPPS